MGRVRWLSWGFPVTLFFVPLDFSAREASEVVALDVFEHAAGEPVTHAMVTDRIAELLTYPAGCRRCSRRCRVAGKAKPSQVIYLVRQWQAAARRSPSAVHVSRRQARRAASVR